MITGFFFMLFLIFLFIVAIGGSIIRGILNLIFGRTFRRSYGTAQGGFGHTEQRHQSASNAQQSTSNSQQSASSGGKKREKIFDKTDGEYVDFEEIKE